jgi:hypothetical protein
MIEEPFRPQKAIILSELSTREKEKYYSFLLMNHARFTRDSEGRYVTNIRLLAPGMKKSEVLQTLEQKKKKETNSTSNYALVFQERLTKLRNNGFIAVKVSGIHQYNYDSFDYNTYPRFVALIAYENETVKPKLRPLSWVMKMIEDLYDARFAYEKHDVEREDDMSSFDMILLIFPIFVVRKLGTTVGLKSLVDSTCWDLLFSLDYYRNDYLECELFGRFLQEFYDHNDLLFYLYVRSVIAKVLHIHFKNRWTSASSGNKSQGDNNGGGTLPGRQPQSLWMSYREALHITGIIFGKDNREMIRDFMMMITPQMVGQVNESTGTDSRRIDITEYLHLSVVGYHQSQSRANQAKQAAGDGISDRERYLVPLPGQTAPMEPIPRLPNRQQHSSSAYDEEGGILDRQRVERGHILGAKSVDEEGVAGAAEAYDLEEEERGYEAEYKANLQNPISNKNKGSGRNSRENQLFQQIQSLPLSGYDSSSQFSPIGRMDHSPQGEEGLPFSSSFDQMIMAMGEGGLDQGGLSGDAGGNNAFEQLQSDREQEFMLQLCSSLQDAPSDIYDYVSSTLKDRLHQTVRLFSFFFLIL